jgi:hypothetical protein
MKLYCVVVTILLALVLGYLATGYYVEKRDSPKEIAKFKGVDGKSISYKLTYSKNGNLAFSSIKPDPNRPAIIHWDYYGSTEVLNHKWLSENSITIETKDSIIEILVPEFTVTAKD